MKPAWTTLNSKRESDRSDPEHSPVSNSTLPSLNQTTPILWSVLCKPYYIFSLLPVLSYAVIKPKSGIVYQVDATQQGDAGRME